MVEEDDGWLVVNVYKLPPTREPLRSSDVIVAVGTQRIDQLNALSTASVFASRSEWVGSFHFNELVKLLLRMRANVGSARAISSDVSRVAIGGAIRRCLPGTVHLAGDPAGHQFMDSLARSFALMQDGMHLLGDRHLYPELLR